MLVSYMPLAPAALKALQSAAVAVIRAFGRSADSASIHCSGALSTSHAWHSYLAIMHCTVRLLLAAIAARCSAISAAGKLRNVLRAPGAVVCPGVHDALSTKIFAEAGAQVLFLSGFGVSACRGEPDAGIITRIEMEDVARQCVRAAGDVPLIVDGDTGFGGASNLRRTIRGFAQAGAAAISIEDQAFPKRCTFAAGTGVRVVDRDAAVARVRAALRARDEAKDAGNDVLVIARTDCRAALGLDEAIARCAAFDALGADIVYGAFAACEYLHICSAIALDAIEQTSRRRRH
jgi:2-methylisocitrate lyase-like PEP mutase family enzyme